MADETTAVDDTEGASAETVSPVLEPTTEIEPKRDRAAGATKAAASSVSDSVPSDRPAVGGKRRGQTRSKTKPGAAEARPPRRSRRPRALTATASEVTATLVPAAASDELADLLQLDEENQRLRKLLAEKLRAENADLRKRLGVS